MTCSFDGKTSGTLYSSQSCFCFVNLYYCAIPDPVTSVSFLLAGICQDPIREISTLSRLSDPGHAHVLRRVEALDDGAFVLCCTTAVVL